MEMMLNPTDNSGGYLARFLSVRENQKLSHGLMKSIEGFRITLHDTSSPLAMFFSAMPSLQQESCHYGRSAGGFLSWHDFCFKSDEMENFSTRRAII